MKEALTVLLEKAIATARTERSAGIAPLKSTEPISIVVEIPPQKEQGDYATPVVLSLAKLEKRPPREVASVLHEILNRSLPSYIEKIEIAGPGYLNFFIKKDHWHNTLLEILNKKQAYGRAEVGGKRVLIEFVSANPTGPLHVAHGRAAALGDSITRLLRAAGYQVDQEYYINDVGVQMSLLGRSTALRYRELLGETITLPEESYRGDYIIDIAREIHEKKIANAESDDSWFGQYSYQKLLTQIKDDLNRFGINFNHWFREADLYQTTPDVPKRPVDSAIAFLREKGEVYDADGATWVATTRYGDDKDRVILRSNGETTYFASDIAYHKDKFDRGYDRLIDIWGADHHGYIARVKAAVAGMGYSPDRLDIVIHQLVNLLRGGKPVAMSKRSGEFVTLKEVMDEVGVDAIRFFFLMRRSDTSLDFDLELAKKTTDENPVYYVQYAHARLCSILRVAAEQGIHIDTETASLETISLLNLPDELELIKRLSFYSGLVVNAAEQLEPHRINFYLLELAGLLHRYYFQTRVVTEDVTLTKARLLLITAIRTVLKSALDLLGVSAPEKM
jgi:arginyl-tRNA synthetase